MKILVTGSAGFIGYHLSKRLLEAGNQVVGIDSINDYYDVRLKYARLETAGIHRNLVAKGQPVQSDRYPAYRFIQMHLEDRQALQNLFGTEKFDAVVNLAAQAGVRYSIENPYAYIDSNIVGFLNLLECVRHNPVRHFVYASSSSVYGGNTKTPFSEEDRVDNPVSLYAATKKSNELMAHVYSGLYGIPTTGLRFFTVYGPWGRPDIDSIIKQTYSCRIYIGVDGPIGNSLNSCLEAYENNKNVSIVRFAENRGLACVLNDLLQICFDNGYEYIARMDADDISLPDRIEKQICFLNEHPEIDVVGGAINEIDEEGCESGKTIVYPATPTECKKFFAKRNPLAHPAVLFRKSFFDKIGHCYRPEYRKNQDTMLWYDGLMHGVNIANLPNVVLKFRMTEALFKKRRNGWVFAKKQLADRLQINKNLHYGHTADLFAYAMFCLLIAPAWVKKIAYKIFR